MSVSITDSPALPAKCISCNNDHALLNVPFVDLGMSMDYYGALTICKWCVFEAARLLDYRVEDILLRDTAVAELQEKNEALLAELETYRGVVDSLNSIRPGLTNWGKSDVPDDEISDEESEQPELSFDGSDSERGSKGVPLFSLSDVTDK